MQRRFVGLVVSIVILLFLGLILLVNPRRQRSEYPKFIGQAHSQANALYELANKQEQGGQLEHAKNSYQRFLDTFPNDNRIAEVNKRLGDLNIKILFSPAITVDSVAYDVQPKDSLTSIAKKFNTTVELLKKSNNLTGNLIRPGMRLKVYTGKFSCVVDKSQNILILKSNEEVLKTYSVSTGINNSTPNGTFKIVNKLANPVWYKSGAIVPPESPDNILGSRWLGFSLSGYGIHGTTDPTTIGNQVTQGCVRMKNGDVEELFDILPIGTEVTIID